MQLTASIPDERSRRVIEGVLLTLAAAGLLVAMWAFVVALSMMAG